MMGHAPCTKSQLGMQVVRVTGVKHCKDAVHKVSYLHKPLHIMLLHTIWLAVFSLFFNIIFLVPHNIAAGSVVITIAASQDLLIYLHVSSQFE